MSEAAHRSRSSTDAAANHDNRYDSLKDEAAAAAQGASELVTTVARGAGEVAETVSAKLKTVGVDTDVMVNAAKDNATELQRLISDELTARPMRALGIAAAVGVLVGMMTARG